MYHSQWGQDKIVDEYFHGKRDGFFVDVGAHDGISLSNTYFLEKERGWTGICVEPIIERYKELVVNRPNSICIDKCMYSHNGTVLFRQLVGYSEMLSGIYHTYNPKHLERIRLEQYKKGGKAFIMNKNCLTLDTLFTMNSITNIDYLTIDTEGSEEEILKGIDFSKVNISMIDVEKNYDEDHANVHTLLTSKGYEVYMHCVGDILYIKK